MLPEWVRENFDPAVDVVADEPHAVHAIGAASEEFVGARYFNLRAVDGFDVGVVAEHDAQGVLLRR